VRITRETALTIACCILVGLSGCFILAAPMGHLAFAATVPPVVPPVLIPHVSLNVGTSNSPQDVSQSLQILLLLTILSLAPAILIMMTSFTRIVIVLSLLRQALGTASLPPNQVLVALSLFMTFLVMGPTFTRINSEALQPYMRPVDPISQEQAVKNACVPLRDFMIGQIENTGNKEDVLLFTDHAGKKI